MPTELRPQGDSLVKATWRGEDRLSLRVQRHCHAYPVAGTQGAPLTEPCPESHAEAGAWCRTCGGSGRVAPLKGWDTPACG